ncbi:hypothetical protein GPALN_010988 [Globodera pallida]|nr:hypothetical protein GPALN_010988 [Globodera pallida]
MVEEFTPLVPPVQPYDCEAAASSTSAVRRQQNNCVVVDPCAHVVHVLMCYQVGGGDADFVRKAIESLVKKLKDCREQLDSLISAVTSGGKQPTSCVTIPRSLDGRLQVAGRKGLPHVVYARIWRWPNVNKTELLKLHNCAIPADHPDLICINPFHYDRVVSSGIANFDIATFRMEPLLTTSADSPHRPLDEQHPMPIAYPSANLPDPFAHPSFLTSSLTLPMANRQLPADQLAVESANAFVPFPSIPTVHHCQQPRQVVHCSDGSVTAFQQQQPPCANATGQLQTRRSKHYNFELPQLPPIHNLPEHWCAVTYFELDTQLGEWFKVPWEMEEVTIDGGMDPSGAFAGRFCLGALSNVHRSEASERARLHIGKGIALKFVDNGEAIFMKCLSQKSVFVRSQFMDFEFGRPGGEPSVHKICPGAERKVFDLRWAYAEMCGRLENAQLSAIAHAYAVAGISSQMAPSSLNSGERAVGTAATGVDDLRRMCCTVSLSFVKGWGEGYGRTTIKETPCWIEVQLHRPLQLLNELLQRPEC